MFRKKIKHISLDFDGVFADSNLSFAKEFTTIGNGLTGKNVSIQDIFNNWGGNIYTLLPIFYPEINAEEYSKERMRLNFHTEAPTPIPGIFEALEELSAKYTLSIITNRQKFTLLESLHALKIDLKLFEKIQSSDDSHYNKPDPRVFNNLSAIYLTNEILYIGDHHEADYVAATGAGIPFVGVLSGGISNREDFLQAGLPEKMILNSIADLPAFLSL